MMTFVSELSGVFGQLDSPETFAKILLGAVTKGDWEVVAAAALVVLVAGIRVYGSKLQEALPDSNPVDKALTWLFTNTWGGWTLNVTTAIAGAFATALLANAPITWALVQTALLTALSGAALWELVKDVLAAVAARKAADAGSAAAAKITTAAAAIKAINGNRKPKP